MCLKIRASCPDVLLSNSALMLTSAVVALILLVITKRTSNLISALCNYLCSLLGVCFVCPQRARVGRSPSSARRRGLGKSCSTALLRHSGLFARPPNVYVYAASRGLASARLLDGGSELLGWRGQRGQRRPLREPWPSSRPSAAGALRAGEFVARRGRGP